MSLRLAVVGCGRVAVEMHLPALRQVPEVRVTALCDPDRARAERMAAALGGVVVTELGPALDLADAVAVLTPPVAHADLVLAALDAGKSVLVEKPLAASLTDCDRMLASGSAARVMVGLNLRHHRLVQEARHFVRSGRLGRVSLVRSLFTHDRTGQDSPAWHHRADTGGGILHNEAGHHFDLWRFLLGVEVEEVACTSLGRPPYQAAAAAVSARLSDGTLASGSFGLHTGSHNELEICGEAGRLLLSCHRFDGLLFQAHDGHSGDARDRWRQASALLRQLPEGLAARRRGGDLRDSFRRMWQHFVDCVRGRAEPNASLADGRSAVTITTACTEAAGSGKTISLRADK